MDFIGHQLDLDADELAGYGDTQRMMTDTVAAMVERLLSGGVMRRLVRRLPTRGHPCGRQFVGTNCGSPNWLHYSNCRYNSSLASEGEAGLS